MNEETTGRSWEKPLADWRRIFAETPDYDCWPAPIRGWEVGALIKYIGMLEAKANLLDECVTSGAIAPWSDAYEAYDALSSLSVVLSNQEEGD